MSYVRPDAVVGTEDFTAGFVDAAEDDSIPYGATTNARNCFLSKVEVLPGGAKRALLAKRPGSVLLSLTAMAPQKDVDLYEFRREAAAPSLLARCGGAWFRYNDLDTFTLLPGLTGFTGETARGVTFRNQAWLYDGVKQMLWDGTTARAPGFAGPTSVTAMTAAAGPGPTGTYNARYTWYDQLHDHDSSPSPVTTDLTITNQARVHTKPGGTPAAHVTHWRAWVKKSTETFWGLVATVPIGTATFTEAILDDARVLTILGGETDNHPLSIVPAVAGIHLEHGIAFPLNSVTMHISRQGDIEAWPPRRQFKVGPEDGEAVTMAKSYGAEFLIMKPHRSWRLIGTEVPFDIEPLHGSFGCVSQEAGIEVGDWFYGWDRMRGPYRTNLTTWVPLADYRLSPVLLGLNGAALDGIRAVHDEVHTLILWSVPDATGTKRRRTLLAYHYGVDAWLAPMTGLEYHSLSVYMGPDGERQIMCGDEWGRVHQLFTGSRDSVPPGPSTVRGTLASATTTSITDPTAAFLTTGAGLAGLMLAVHNIQSNTWEWRRIASNTATVLTLDTTFGDPFTTAPLAGDEYLVGGIEWYWTTPFLHFGEPFRQKRLHWLFCDFKPTGDHAVAVAGRFDRAAAISTTFPFFAHASGGVWGEMVWGQGKWGAQGVTGRKKRINRVCISIQLLFYNFYPDQAVELARYAIEGQMLPNRRVTS